MANFKIYDFAEWTKIIAIHNSSNMLTSKGSQIIKFGQLIEYKMRNIFLGKSNT